MENEAGDGAETITVDDSTHFQAKYPWAEERHERADRLQKMLDEAMDSVKLEQVSLTKSTVEMPKILQNPLVTIDKPLEEDARIDYLLRMQKTLNETFNNLAWMHPHGLAAHDTAVIPECRHKGLENFKMNIRRHNYMYLHHHPELDALVSVFLKRLLKTQPKDSVRFAIEFFTFRRMGADDLVRLVNDELSKLKQYRNPKGWKQGRARSHGDSETLDFDMKGVNDVKSLSLGPLTEPYEFTPPSASTSEKPSSLKKSLTKTKPKAHVYCGCKDPQYSSQKPKVNLNQSPRPPPKPFTVEQCYGLPTHKVNPTN